MIEIKNVTKKYGDNIAVKNVSFTVNDGEIFALADLYIDIFGKEAFEELIKESK